MAFAQKWHSKAAPIGAGSDGTQNPLCQQTSECNKQLTFGTQKDYWSFDKKIFYAIYSVYQGNSSTTDSVFSQIVKTPKDYQRK
jgi:hypothetical protein